MAWLAKHRPDPTIPLHVCMEATGNWALELADFLHAQQVRVSIVNPARIKAYGDSELARNKTDKLDAALIGRFCRAHVPAAWVPAAPHLRELRELVRRCDALKSTRVQELNRQKSGFASPAVEHSIASHLEWLNDQIEAVMDEVRHLIAADPDLSRNFALIRSITGFGVVAKGSVRVAHGMATEVRSRQPSCWQNSLTSPTSRPRPLPLSSACPLANIAPGHPCAGQARSAVSARNVCAAHFICAPSAPNGTTNPLPPSRACPLRASRPRSF